MIPNPPNNKKYDSQAEQLYMLHSVSYLRRTGHKFPKAFANLSRRDKDYWRARAQVALEENLYPGLEKGLDIAAEL